MLANRCLTRLRSISNLILRSSSALSIVQSKSFSLVTSRAVNSNRVQNLVNHTIVRNKYVKRSSNEDEVSKRSSTLYHAESFILFQDSDDETEFHDELDKKSIAKVTVQSLRADLLLKQGIGMARNKIETAFYENRIRINGKKIQKKSVSCSVGDEIDLIKGESPTNPNHLLIARIEIISTKPNLDSIKVTMRRFKSLTVEKYD